MRALAALALLAAAPGSAQAPAEGTQGPQPAARAGDYPYQLFVPRGYAADRRQRWPLMIFLHGSGERGDDIARVKVHGPPRIVGERPGTPMLVASPLLEADGDWDVGKLDQLLADLRRAWRVDADRIYLTGLSRGGHATWRWAAARSGTFAAIAPVAGRGDPAVACALKDTPVWALHGDSDDVVQPEGSFAMVEAIRRCPNITVQPRLTIFAGTNHNSWDPAYADPALWRWFAEQRRVAPALSPR